MNKEDIIRMAREADLGFLLNENWLMHEELERFAALVASAAQAKEREACAELCEMLDVENAKGKSWDEGTIDCANAIRARGQA